jgi:two-component system, chemotaxis family, protein-glutamate methylesterase/glutaminase
MNWGELTPFTCPSCHGVLVRLREDRISRFRCHTGHGYTVNALLAGVDEPVESQLWQAMRALEENSMLLREMAESFARAGQKDVAERLLDKVHQKANLARSIHDSLPRHEKVSGELRHEEPKPVRRAAANRSEEQ